MQTEYIKNVRSGSLYYSTTKIAYTEADAGLTAHLSTSATVSSTISNTFGFTKKQISASTGVDVSKSITFSIGVDFPVLEKHNGKSVNYGILYATPIYKTTYFDVYRGIQGTDVEKKIGTGTIKTPYSIKYHKTYVYN